MKLTLDKSGVFTTWFISGQEHRKCGMAATTAFNYDVHIEGTDKKLSDEGFLIENGRIQEYFESTYAMPQPVRSCELIACIAARALAELLKKDGAHVYNVTVTIHGTPGAKLTAVWDHKDKM